METERKTDEGLSEAQEPQVHAYVYMMRCADGSLYTGWSSNPRRREKVHNSGKGARYTRSRLPVKLVYAEKCSSRKEALRREYEIKQLSHREKEALISQVRNEKWENCTI